MISDQIIYYFKTTQHSTAATATATATATQQQQHNINTAQRSTAYLKLGQVELLEVEVGAHRNHAVSVGQGAVVHVPLLHELA